MPFVLAFAVWKMDGAETDGLEMDVTETAEGDGWRRGMARGGKARTNGPSVLMAFHLREILLCHSSWPLQSRRRRKAEMSPRRRKAKMDVARMDVPETEGMVFFLNLYVTFYWM